jgi:hypothetical protein
MLKCTEAVLCFSFSKYVFRGTYLMKKRVHVNFEESIFQVLQVLLFLYDLLL